MTTDVIGIADHCGNLDNLTIFQTAKREDLRDQAWLEHTLTYDLGLYPAQGIPQGMWSLNGLGICQHPNQFAPYLIYLSTLGVKAYAEIGLWVGGAFATTVEYLRRFGLKRALGIDVLLQDSAKRYAEQQPIVELYETSSTSKNAAAILAKFRPDLTLVDGDHTYAGAVNDWELASAVSRWVALHDIIGYPDVTRLWDELDDETRERHEWIAQYPELPGQAGIGLVKGNVP